MTSYIGTAVSRVDGRAKVTGAAKYAGEYHPKDLAHGSVDEPLLRIERLLQPVEKLCAVEVD